MICERYERVGLKVLLPTGMVLASPPMTLQNNDLAMMLGPEECLIVNVMRHYLGARWLPLSPSLSLVRSRTVVLDLTQKLTSSGQMCVCVCAIYRLQVDMA